MLQIRHENQRFERRLEHEAKEKAVERAMQIKREVFMTVCEALALGSQFLSKFADAEMPREKHQQLISEIGPRLYRVHLIGSDETIQALINAYEFFVKAMLDLEGTRLPINMYRADQARAEAALKQNQEFEQSLMSEIAKLEGSAPNLQLQQFLMGRLTSVRTLIADLLNKCTALNTQILTLHMGLVSKAIHLAMDFENYGTKAVIAMRVELAFPITNDRYETILRAVRERTKAGVDSFIARTIEPLGISQPKVPAPSEIS